MTPEYLSSKFVFRNRNTENKLALTQPRTNYLKKNSLTAEPGCGTAYPVTVVQATSLRILNLTYVTTE